PYIPMLVENNVRKGFFEQEQFSAVRSHLPEHLRPVADFAYITGWRVRSELLTRGISHVAERAGWVRFEPGETKNGDGRMFPLLSSLRTALQEQRAYTEKIQKAQGRIVRLLFHRKGKPIRGFRKAWQTACLRAGFARLVSEKPRVIEGAPI